MPRKMSRDEYNEYMREYMARRYRSRRRKAKKFLGGKCVSCGSKRKLEFDHIDRKTKLKTIARMWSYSEDRFWAEIEKCQLLCSKCHGLKSLEERGLKKNKGVHGTAANYSRYGCRCDLCRKANNDRNNEWRWRTGRRKRRGT